MTTLQQAPPVLFAHQQEVIDLALKRDFLALFLQQGLGKTRCAIEVAKQRNVWPVLVVCPATVIGVWIEEITKWAPGWTAIPVTGSRQRRIDTVTKYIKKEKTIFVINYEGIRIWTHKEQYRDSWGKTRYKHTNDFANHFPWKMAIIDESSRIKTPKTQQSRACHALSRVPFRYILSGTPITKSPLDLWSQYRFLSPSTFPKTYYEFELKYAVKEPIYAAGGRRVLVQVGVKNENELLGLAHQHAIIKKKDECLDLPPKIFQREEVEIIEDQRGAYRDLAEHMIAYVGEGVVSTPSVLSQILRLQEVVQGFTRTNTGKVVEFKRGAKERVLEDLLGKVLPDQKAVIWYRFRPEENIIFRAAKAAGFENGANINGEVKIERRSEIISEFQSGKYDFLTCQYQTCSYGITLTAASYCIFFSQNWDIELRWQASDRLHRIGQDKNVVEVDILAKNTIDESIVEACKRKSKWASRFDRYSLERLISGKI